MTVEEFRDRVYKILSCEDSCYMAGEDDFPDHLRMGENTILLTTGANQFKITIEKQR